MRGAQNPTDWGLTDRVDIISVPKNWTDHKSRWWKDKAKDNALEELQGRWVRDLVTDDQA